MQSKPRNYLFHSTAVAFLIFMLLIPVTATSESANRPNVKPSLSQLTIPLGERKPYRYWANSKDRAIVLEIQQISPNQITGLEDYDESFIRRLRVRDLGGNGTEIKLTLRDDDTAATINYYEEPARLVIELFPKIVTNLRDPITGFPLAFDKKDEPHNDPSPSSDRKLALDPEPTSTNSIRADKPSVQRLLMQSSVAPFNDASELVAAMNQSKDGLGPYWKEYPPYIYRLQTALFENSIPDREFIKKQSSTAVNSADALADYAGRLFDFGHEAKALVAYQGVLREDAAVFEKSPLHLWRFAEAHFAHGNLTLSEGYFQLLIDKFPGHALSPFAKLRRLDINCIRLLQSNPDADLGSLAADADAIQPKTSSELQAQLAIRRGFWLGAPKSAETKSAKILPVVDDPTRINLQNSLPGAENAKTSFWGYSLVMQSQCQESVAWNKELAMSAQNYFKRFSGDATEPHRSNLSACIKSKLERHLTRQHRDANYIAMIQDYESLPESLKSVHKNPTISWALAESYRHLGQNMNAATMYEKSASNFDSSEDKVRSNFWAVTTLQSESRSLKGLRGKQAAIDINQRKILALDRSNTKLWDSLEREKKDSLFASLKTPLEKSLADKEDRTLLAPTMVLDQWSKPLTTEQTIGSDQTPGGDAMVSPSAASLQLIMNLAGRFEKIGKKEERQQSLALLKQLKPASFGDDQAARKLWADQIYNLANEYRESNKILESAKLYAQAGSESGPWERRAESLYRGGLLLLRSGQKQEAIDALRKASEDLNNLFYANLAKERLNQIVP